MCSLQQKSDHEIRGWINRSLLHYSTREHLPDGDQVLLLHQWFLLMVPVDFCLVRMSRRTLDVQEVWMCRLHICRVLTHTQENVEKKTLSQQKVSFAAISLRSTRNKQQTKSIASLGEGMELRHR